MPCRPATLAGSRPSSAAAAEAQASSERRLLAVTRPRRDRTEPNRTEQKRGAAESETELCDLRASCRAVPLTARTRRPPAAQRAPRATLGDGDYSAAAGPVVPVARDVRLGARRARGQRRRARAPAGGCRGAGGVRLPRGVPGRGRRAAGRPHLLPQRRHLLRQPPLRRPQVHVQRPVQLVLQDQEDPAPRGVLGAPCSAAIPRATARRSLPRVPDPLHQRGVRRVLLQVVHYRRAHELLRRAGGLAAPRPHLAEPFNFVNSRHPVNVNVTPGLV